MLNKKLSLAFIVVAFFAGTMVTSNIVHNVAATTITLTDIFTIAQNIQTKVSTLVTNVGNTQNAVNAHAPKGIVFHKQESVAPSGTDHLSLIPPQSGKAFSGHITMLASGDSSKIILECHLGKTITGYGVNQDNGRINEDFACESLDIYLHNTTTSTESNNIDAVVEYVEISPMHLPIYLHLP